MKELELRVCTLYPQHMGIYADRGNIAFLEQRCRWRNIRFTLASAGLGDAIDPEAHDLFYMGGGQDRDQRLVAEDMVASKRDSLATAVEGGAVLLAVCGGYQLLGSSYQLEDDELPGLGLVELKTARSSGERLIGNVAIEVDIDGEKKVLAGFENHGGRTYLGQSERPLGRVIKGYGNNGKDKTEGVRKGNLFGTYLHGPLLPKNYWFADYLVELALSRATGEQVELLDLDDRLEEAAHLSARRAV